MSTPFLTGLATDVKPVLDGEEDGVAGNKRYSLCNSRNRNRKVFQLGESLDSQFLGIDAPAVAPTATPGTGGNLYYRYVYVNKKFRDPGALEGSDNFIRSNPSPILTVASVATAATAITPTLSTDPQVTHIWLYVGLDAVDGPWYRLAVNYEVANTGSPTWTGVTAPDTTQVICELDNFVPETCRIVAACNGFYLYAGFVPVSTTANATVGSATVTAGTAVTFYDGYTGLYLRFSGDTTGGPGGNGIHFCKYVDASTLTLVDETGANRNYDGPGNKSDAAVRIWRPANVVQISKRWNQDATPAALDANHYLLAQGPVVGIAKPSNSFSVRLHVNNQGRKSITVVDLAQQLPPRVVQSSAGYAMANPKAYATSGARLFYYDTNAGVVEDRGAMQVPMTLPVIPNLIRSLNPITETISEMLYDESRNLLFLTAAPAGYTRAHYLIVYSLTTNTWNLWFMLPDVLAMGRFKDATTGEIVVKMGSSQGSITVWPSTNFNEAVGASTFGNLAVTDDSTHLTAIGTPFPTTGDKLVDRWVMVWDPLSDVPTYQFARISDNTSSRLTLDTFIGPNSSTELSPVPTAGWAYWVGPIQCILGPCFDFNAPSTPDTDGQLFDFSMVTSGLNAFASSLIEFFRNFETVASLGKRFIHSLFSDGTPDPDHQSVRLGANGSVETTGVTGWRIVDNNECGLSIKAVIRRVRAVEEELNAQVAINQFRKERRMRRGR